jgi:hypothetical protein
MTSTSRTRRANKTGGVESLASARSQRRPRGSGSPSAPDFVAAACTSIAAEAAKDPPSAKVPARITKLSSLIALLERPDGATIAMLCEATGWQAHSVRGAIAGTLKRKGIVVISERSGTGPRHYRIESTS